jgi:hypothetical protein
MMTRFRRLLAKSEGFTLIDGAMVLSVASLGLLLALFFTGK